MLLSIETNTIITITVFKIKDIITTIISNNSCDQRPWRRFVID